MHERVPEPDAQSEDHAHRPSDLRRLGDLPDWQLARGEPDVRGWAVFNTDDGLFLGSVDDLLVSTEMASAVFLILHTGGVIGESDADYGMHGHLNNRHIPIPLDRIELFEEDSRVLFAGSLDQLRDAPEYDPGSRDFGPCYDYWSSI